MKPINLNRICLIFIIALLSYACSSDSDNGSNDEGGPATFDQNATISIGTVEASRVKLNFSGTSNNLNFGLRKSGEQDFVKIDFTNDFIPNLEPAQEYEVTLLVNGLIELPFSVLKFTTAPLDFFSSINSDKVGNNIYSEIGFEHELGIGFTDENTSSDLSNPFKLFLISTSDAARKIELTTTITDGKIMFKIPEEALSSSVYEAIHDYNIRYEVNEVFGLVKELQNEGRDLVFSVLNPKPYIEEVVVGTDICETVDRYVLRLTGNFLNNVFPTRNYYFLNSTLIITRVDDNSTITLEEKQEGCIEFVRNLGQGELPSGLVGIHTAIRGKIAYPETNTAMVKFTTGDYKMKITFSNAEGDFYETNEYEFTLP